MITDIFQFDVPVSAKAGDVVSVVVGLQNISPSNQYVTITGSIDGVPVYFGSAVKLMGAGGIATWYETFVMPNHDVDIFIWSFAKTSLGLPWSAYDNSAQASVSSGAVPGEPTGEIDHVNVMAGSLEQSIPAIGLEVGDNFQLRVKVSNTGTVSFRPYLYYRYTKPDGSVGGSTEAKFTQLDSGEYHVFAEPLFGIDIDQPGEWYIYCELRDDYNGNVLAILNSTLLFNAGGVIPYTDLADVDIMIADGIYEIGESVPFSVTYNYRGPAQLGILVITLGHPEYTFPEIFTELQMSMAWASGVITGNIVLPDVLEPGQTYSVQGTLRTEDGRVEKTDVDLSVITIYDVPPLTGEIGTMQLVEMYITKDLPAPDMVKNDFFSVLVPVNNTSDYEGRFYLDCIITKPSGATIGRTDEQQNLNPGQEHTFEIQPEGIGFAFRIDEVGDWYVECVLKSEAEELARTPNTHLFTAGSEGATSDLQVYDLEATLPSDHPVLGPLDVLDIGVTFKYTSTEDTELQLWASLSLGVGRDVESFKAIQLTKSALENTWSGDTTLQIPESGIPDGEYTLKVEVAGTEITISGAVTLEGMPETAWGDIGEIGTLIGMLVLMMVVQMLMGLMGEVGGLVSTVAVKGGEVVGARTRLLIEKAEEKVRQLTDRVRQLRNKLEDLVRRAKGMVGEARERIEEQIEVVEKQIGEAEEQVRRAEEQVRQYEVES